MRIEIHSQGKRSFRLRIPNWLLGNRLSLAIFEGINGEQGFRLTATQMRAILKIIKEYRKTHPGWQLLDIRSSNGDSVEIWP